MSVFTRRIFSVGCQMAQRRGLTGVSCGDMLRAMRCASSQASIFTSRVPGSRSLCYPINSLSQDKRSGNGVRKLHTTGDQNLANFLNDEIKLEKDHEKKLGKLPKIKDFEVTKTDGPSVVLTRKLNNETITVKFNINNSVEDSSLMNGEVSDAGVPEMVSRPAFVVEINKGGDKTLALHCILPSDSDIPPTQDHEQPEEYDLVEIQDVTLLNKSQEWTDEVYALSGSIMDGNLYDMLMQLLEERGINADFLEEIVDFSTSYEHGKYVEFLEQLKGFVDSK